jgi:hypothetical protein
MYSSRGYRGKEKSGWSSLLSSTVLGIVLGLASYWLYSWLLSSPVKLPPGDPRFWKAEFTAVKDKWKSEIGGHRDKVKRLEDLIEEEQESIGTLQNKIKEYESITCDKEMEKVTLCNKDQSNLAAALKMLYETSRDNK